MERLNAATATEYELLEVNTITVNSQQISLTTQQQSIAIQQVVSAMNALSQAANRGSSQLMPME
ncbi:hypothetical protein NG798_27125 [Ancylothrix sp. C2]|nr:hypothetical protein [Ancylothrix sp. D3o]